MNGYANSHGLAYRSTHQCRFAAAYRALPGENPGDTLCR
jgi:hypothetical protein